MFSTLRVVASSGGDEITMPRSSLRIRVTRSTVVLALLAGSTVKSWSYLFLKYRASLARSPARAAATGDDSRPTAETLVKSTVDDKAAPYPPPNRPFANGRLKPTASAQRSAALRGRPLGRPPP